MIAAPRVGNLPEKINLESLKCTVIGPDISLH